MKYTVKARDIERLIGEVGAAQQGVVTGAQLRRRGVSIDAIRHRVRTGRIVRLKHDIYRLADHPFTWEAQLQAALFDAGEGALLSHRTAAQLHGFWHYRDRCAIEVTGPELHDHRITLARLHRTADMPASHRTVVAGFPVTTVARTCFDLIGDPEPHLRHSDDGRQLHATLMTRVLNDALGRRGLTLGQLAAVVATIGKRGRPGSALTRELVTKIGPSYVPPGSDGESLVMELVETFELPQPERQVVLSDEQGWIGNVDFLWRPPGLILEIDGSWHDGPLDRAADAARDARVIALGLKVWRVRYGDLVSRPDAFVHQLRVNCGAIAPQLHQHSAPDSDDEGVS
jgi:hypothetical protein